MTTILATLTCFVLYLAGYHLYAKHLGRRIFQLDPQASTPAHQLQDDIDYVPTNKYILFGHHYASITGLSPMLGPAIAVIWGWVPAMLWVVFGTLFIGAVHDFGALVISMRARGKSVGKVAEEIIGSRAKTLFHIIIFFLIALAMGVFVHVTATLLTTAYSPEAVYPCTTLIALAVVVGWLVYRKNASIWRITLVVFAITLFSVWLGIRLPIIDLTRGQWSLLLLGYAFLASVLPVWLLLQPRDYINSLLLYLGLASIYAGFFVLQPEFAAPAVQAHPEGAPPLFPFVFIVIACGAISGFHGLVSSGTTAKQINKETDAPFIGYGGMIGESLLGLVSVLACTAGFVTRDLWMSHYNSWDLASGLGPNMQAFIDGSALFLSQLGISLDVAKAFVALVAISFALTTLDSGTRLLRFNISEISETVRFPLLSNRYVASLLAVIVIGFVAFYKIEGQPAGLALWQLFGTTNQILGGFTLLTVTLYLMHRRRPYWYTGVPMGFMLITTLTAMAIKMRDFWNSGAHLLLVLGISIFLLSVWLAWEATLRIFKGEKVADLSKAAQ
ncbi:carbon starvation protein A [Acidobacteria bacterium AH-259-G07]|nr:carbon starvation protein A [Acidobacteria bacterium AH-259-G07]